MGNTILSFLKSLNWPWLISTLFVPLPIWIGFYKWKEEQNEKRKYDLYIKKEQLYLSMQKNSWGFYTNTFDIKKQLNFDENVQNAWLYCPDSIIMICNDFLKSRFENPNNSNALSQEIIKKLMFEMRKDLLSNKYLSNTSLSPSDFLLVGPVQDTTAKTIH